MRQVWISKKGAPEVLEVREAADPDAGEGQVRIRARACGINFADLAARIGLYPDAPPIPCVVGYECAGTVDQVGAGVTTLAVGDRAFGMPKFGGYSDTVVLPAGQAFKMPDKMTFEEGAALPVVYLTAHHMMYYVGHLRRGMKVLIHSAAGGVGLAAIQLARAQGCEIFGTASPSKHEFLKKEGVAHPIDSTGDVAAAARAILGEKGGFDLILDPVGGRSWNSGYQLLGAGGHMIAFGFSSAQGAGKTRSLLHAVGEFVRIKKYNPMNLMNDNKTVSGVNMGHLFDRLDILRPQFEALIKMYEAGEIKPYVDKTFSFVEAAAAHHYIHDRKAKGKVLLVP